MCGDCSFRRTFAEDRCPRFQHPSEGFIARGAARSHVWAVQHHVWFVDSAEVSYYSPLGGYILIERTNPARA